ncbi:MAG: MMPL family transporter [Bacteroidetes bacterium]|nr:MMPL family transporter [Bacteroidota bacterium]
MFQLISIFILRNRRMLLAVIAGLTLIFGFLATRIELSYDFARVLPANDPFALEYEKFKATFGEDGSVIVLGVKDSNFYQLKKFNDWYQLGQEIKAIDGIEAVVSVAGIYTIQNNETEKKFDVRPIISGKVKSQEELDSIKLTIDALPFYNGLIVSEDKSSTLMAITFDKKKLNTKSRLDIVAFINEKAKAFGVGNDLEIHISGMPFIRTAITGKVAKELQLFLLLAIIVCSLILLIFFRSFKVVLFSVIVVLVGVVWSVGTIALFGYKITILTGLIPPLIIVIGIPNSILLLNKYHTEYGLHGNKIKALSRMIQRIGLTTFLANLTTAIGFGVFYFTNSKILMEFGLIAAINVMATYLISLVLVPIVFSFLPAPEVKHTKHLNAPRLNKMLDFIDHLVHAHYRKIFVVVGIISLIAIYGIGKISTVGYVVDDLPKNDPVYKDMRFFEKNFKGVLPFEIMIDTKQPGKALDPVTLQKINRLEKMLVKYPEFSKPLATVDGIKFSYQSFRGGDPKYYILPGTLDLAEMASYMKGDAKDKSGMFRSFLDSTRQTTRVSVQMADVGSIRMKQLVEELRPRIDSIFEPADYSVAVTGNSLIFLRGNDYLFKNLLESIILAIILISLIMFALFMSFRMITVSILPSLIPLLITAGIMGYFQIPLKPSTILIFSIAFGISSDGTIYFLTKYRHELRLNPMSISKAVSLTIRETGVSMVYTAIILFFGFFIFSASSFGGTASLGILLSITLLVAMASNLILLPAFLISLERRITTKAFLEEPLIQVFDEDEDIELGDLEIRKIEETDPEKDKFKD